MSLVGSSDDEVDEDMRTELDGNDLEEEEEMKDVESVIEGVWRMELDCSWS